MKKIIWIIAVLLLTFVGDRVGAWVLKKMTDQSQFRYSRLYSDTAAADILLVGNSRGLIFYQPYIEEKTGKSTLNLSYNGIPVDLMSTLVHDYFERYPAPERMIVDVTLCDRINKELISGFNTYGAYSERLDSFIIAQTPTMGKATRVTHLFRYNSEIFYRALYYSNKSDEDWLLDRVMGQNLIDGANDLPPFPINVEPDSTDRDYLTKHLNALVQVAQKNGTKVELVINPYYPPFAKSIPNMVSFKQKVEKATGLAVRDYSEAIQEVKGFGDYQHLNKYGAKRYLDQLFRDGVLE